VRSSALSPSRRTTLFHRSSVVGDHPHFHPVGVPLFVTVPRSCAIIRTFIQQAYHSLSPFLGRGRSSALSPSRRTTLCNRSSVVCDHPHFHPAGIPLIVTVLLPHAENQVRTFTQRAYHSLFLILSPLPKKKKGVPAKRQAPDASNDFEPSDCTEIKARTPMIPIRSVLLPSPNHGSLHSATYNGA
jgi:hypothetical protein